MSVIQTIKMQKKNFKKGRLDYYKPDQVPVFFGHYWMKGKLELQKPNVCCLDYSVAKGGVLVAYRWNGEQELNEGGLVYV